MTEDQPGGLPVVGVGTGQRGPATGFRPDFFWNESDVFEEEGDPRHERGTVPEEPDLYFVGLRWLHTARSSLIGGVVRFTGPVGHLPADSFGRAARIWRSCPSASPWWRGPGGAGAA